MPDNRNQRRIVNQSRPIDTVLSAISIVGIAGAAVSFLLYFMADFEWPRVGILISLAIVFICMGLMIVLQRDLVELETKDTVVYICCFIVGGICLIGGIVALILLFV